MVIYGVQARAFSNFNATSMGDFLRLTQKLEDPQPDLHFDAEVRQDMTNAKDFSLDIRVDGLRLDTVPYLYEREGTHCENLTETHTFLKEQAEPPARIRVPAHAILELLEHS
jgi:glycosidase